MRVKRALLKDEENSQQVLITGQVILLQLSFVCSVSQQSTYTFVAM